MSDEPHFALAVDQGIELRLLHEVDAHELFALVEDDRDRLKQWLPWVDYETSPAESLTFIQRSQLQYIANEGFQLGIYAQSRLTGVIGFHGVNWPNRHVEIGYWLGAEFEGQGLMSRSCRTLVNYAFNNLTLNRVEIQCATGNTRSRAVPERLGFTLEGMRREGEWLYDHFVDLVIYGMLARDWQQG